MSKTISFPRSDGDASRWPAGWLSDEVDINLNVNYFERVKSGHAKYGLFLSKIGQHLAERQGLPNHQSYRLTALPDGYELFLHHKLQQDGSGRTDTYLFGSRHVPRFRSPAEMFGHAEWLMKEELDIENHKLCSCKYSSSLSAPVIDPSERKRKAAKTDEAGKSNGEKKQKQSSGPKTLEQRQEEYQKEVLAAVKNRRGELRSRAFGRRGELVWCRLPTVHAPAETTRETPAVTYWPGLVRMIQTKVSTHPGDREVLHSYVYHVRLCGQILTGSGAVDSTADHQLDEVDVLPWATIDSGELMVSVEKDLANIAAEFVQASPLPTDASKTLGEAEKNAPWMKTLTRRFRIDEMAAPQNWDMLLANYAWALRFAMDSSQHWSQTDAYADQNDVRVPGMAPTLAEQEDLAGKRRTHFQGLWWAGERIWMGDLVRMTTPRSSLATAQTAEVFAEAFPDPSPGASDRALFLRIAALAVDEFSDPVAPANRVYECRFFGDLYELAEAGWNRANPLPEKLVASAALNKDGGSHEKANGTNGGGGMVTDITLAAAAEQGNAIAGSGPASSASLHGRQAGSEDSELDVGGRGGLDAGAGAGAGVEDEGAPIPLPEPPKGFVFRRVNAVDSEVTCDLFHVSGRYYPPNFSAHPLITSSAQTIPQIKPTSILHLTGLTHARPTMSSETAKWQQNKYASLMAAHETSLQWLKRYFEDTRDMGARVQEARVLPVADKAELTAAWVRNV